MGAWCTCWRALHSARSATAPSRSSCRLQEAPECTPRAQGGSYRRTCRCCTACQKASASCQLWGTSTLSAGMLTSSRQAVEPNAGCGDGCSHGEAGRPLGDDAAVDREPLGSRRMPRGVRGSGVWVRAELISPSAGSGPSAQSAWLVPASLAISAFRSISARNPLHSPANLPSIPWTASVSSRRYAMRLSLEAHLLRTWPQWPSPVGPIVAWSRYLARSFLAPWSGSVCSSSRRRSFTRMSSRFRGKRPSHAPRTTTRGSKKRLSCSRSFLVSASRLEPSLPTNASQPAELIWSRIWSGVWRGFSRSISSEYSAGSYSVLAARDRCFASSPAWPPSASTKASPATIQAVKPAWSTMEGSALCSRRARTISGCTSAAAKCSGVAPLLSCCRGEALPRSSAWVVSRSPFFTTSMSAVTPSRPGPSGSALEPSLMFPSANWPSSSFCAPSGVSLPPTIGDAKRRSSTVACVLYRDWAAML
mmetsp:Transcript_52794/g.165218  ORF Transcript_52794/g.165218 Transcript_52794/m.165218 type:complete len:477 (+) Transcript_52794:998-2428(+)